MADNFADAPRKIRAQQGRLAYAEREPVNLYTQSGRQLSHEALWFGVAFWCALAFVCAGLFVIGWHLGLPAP
jgi:hypothetical protein